MTFDSESPEALAWAELQRRGSIRPRYLRGIEAEIAGDLARCLDPVVHEQDIRPYGAIVARETPHLDRLGRILDTTGLPDDVARSLADGIHSVVRAGCSSWRTITSARSASARRCSMR